MEAKRAERLSEHTLSDYGNTFKKFRGFLEEDRPINKITEHEIIGFLGSVTNVSKKTIRNYHAGLSSLWNYLVETSKVKKNVVRSVKAPRPEIRHIEPYTREDIIAFLNVIDQSRASLRDRTMILLLLDCGLRASEMCDLTLKEIDIANRKITVKNGKGGKSRKIPFSIKTQEYLKKHIDTLNLNGNSQHPFVSINKKPLDRYDLLNMIVKAGTSAGVTHCNVHRFRHTFAIQFLRNGGNIYTLQALLGHSSLDMVKRYLAIAQTDTERDHEKASPVMGWTL